MSEHHIQRLVVWASGMIEFVGDQPEPDGALTICMAHGERAIERLGEMIVDRSEAWCFESGLALKVPGIDPQRDEVTRGVDPAIEVLIDWGNALRNDLGVDPAFVWARG